MPYWLIAIIVFLVVDFIFIIWVVIKRARARRLGARELQYIESHWIRIIDMFGDDHKHAILDADKLLDYALSKHGFQGNLGEKLKLAGPRFSDLNGVWSAHKLRNRIAHELMDVDKNDAKRALKQFKRALNDLGAQL